MSVSPFPEELGDGLYRPLSPGGQMKCPACTEDTPDAWKSLFRTADKGGGITHGIPSHADGGQVALDYMHCANEECGQLVLRVHQSHSVPGLGLQTNTWNAIPRTSNRKPLDPSVPADIRRDYEEAAAILNLSPRMSAVLSRRILADMLARYAKIKTRRVTAQIDAFNADTSRPYDLRKNLHHLREIADFGAHTQTDERQQIIDVSAEEAEWTLDIVDRLFDYFIVGPAKDAAIRESFDKKLQAADRKLIPPLPDDLPGEVPSS